MDVNGGRRVSIRLKIVGLATLMLALLVVTSLYSHWRLSQVGEEIEELDTHLTPIGRQMNDIVRLTLQQDFHFEQQLIAFSDETPDRQQIEAERNHFQARGEEVAQRLQDAQTMVRRAVADVEPEDDRMALADLEPILKGLEQEHAEFHQHALTIIDLLESTSGAQVDTFLAQLEEQEEDVTTRVEQFRMKAVALRQDAVTESLAHETAVLRAGAAAVILATLLGLLGALLLTSRLVQPIRQLLSAMQEVGQGRLDVEIRADSSDEIGELSQAFGDMVGELGRRDHIKNTFGKYVDPRVVEHLIEKPGALKTGGENRQMTVLFANVDEIATFADHAEPAELVRLINQYLSLIVAPIFRHQGVVDKFIDTMVMAFWGAPFTSEEEHAQLACEASLDLLAQLDEIRHLAGHWDGTLADLPSPHLRIGLNSGSLLVGNMGSDQSKSYTVLGDTVNIASRLKGVCKQYGAAVLMTQDTHRMVEGTMETREIDWVQVVGRREPVRVYELLGRRGAVATNVTDLRVHFEHGLEAYRQQAWDQAQSHFEACLDLVAQDGPATLYLERVHQLRTEPPPHDWDGVWHLTHK